LRPWSGGSRLDRRVTLRENGRRNRLPFQLGEGHAQARSACRNTGHDPSSVFRDVTKIVDAGPLQRGRADVQMLRFGCYLVAMNGDPDKSEVAAAQRYFAVMTRVAEKQVTAPAAIIEKPRPWSERFRETTIPHLRFVNVNHPGCFTVVTTLVAPILYLEDELIRHMLKPGPSDRPDVSIGLCWANDRRSRGLPDVERFAPLCLPDQEREVWLKVYDNAERGECEAWFARTYLRDKLPNYLTCKPSFRVYGGQCRGQYLSRSDWTAGPTKALPASATHGGRWFLPRGGQGADDRKPTAQPVRRPHLTRRAVSTPATWPGFFFIPSICTKIHRFAQQPQRT
jgi:hypothetical protein